MMFGAISASGGFVYGAIFGAVLGFIGTYFWMKTKVEAAADKSAAAKSTKGTK
jgi:membrane protease YdiL (CAAX protease family)